MRLFRRLTGSKLRLWALAAFAAGTLSGCGSMLSSDAATPPGLSASVDTAGWVRVVGRHFDISVEVPGDWSVGDLAQLQAIDRTQHRQGDPFVTTEIHATAGPDFGGAWLTVSLRQPPSFSDEQWAELGQPQLQQANKVLEQSDGSSSDGSSVPVWSLRDIEFKGRLVRCLELTTVHRTTEPQAPVLWRMRRLYVPRPWAELQLETLYRVRDEARWLPAWHGAVASLRD